MKKNTPEGYITIKGYKFPYFHDPKIDCGCSNCALANKRISLQFYLGLQLSNYVEENYRLADIAASDKFDATNKEHIEFSSTIEIYHKMLLQFFTEDELNRAVCGIISEPNIK